MELESGVLDGPGGPSAPRKLERVLVVDDEDLVRELTRTMVQRMGYPVLVASNGEEALRVFERHEDSIIAIVLDQTMPVLGGHGVVSALRARGQDVPILVVTGYTSEAVLDELRETPGVSILHKPYRQKALAEALGELLG